MTSEPAPGHVYRALSIAQIQVANAAPVVYDLTGETTEIGAAENNAIILSHPSVAPYHLTVRQAGGHDHLLVDLAERRRYRDRTWHQYRSGDAYWCPRHGRFKRLDNRAWCPECKRRRGSLWLMRPLKPGDSFDIGSAFRATYISQEHSTLSDAATPTTPALEMFERPARIARPIVSPVEPEIPVRDLPTDDSNLWRWQPAEMPFPIFMHQRVNFAITQHAKENHDREVGGVLLGDVCRDRDGRMFVVFTHTLKAEFTDETRGHLTFTHKSWLKMHTTREAQFPDKRIVGWYHTHPGWSIFLSEWDLFIHQNFFKQPWQVALVIDPQVDRAGFFVWQANRISNPQAPVEPFRLAELDGWATPPRVRIKLTGFAPAPADSQVERTIGNSGVS